MNVKLPLKSVLLIVALLVLSFGFLSFIVRPSAAHFEKTLGKPFAQPTPLKAIVKTKKKLKRADNVIAKDNASKTSVEDGTIIQEKPMIETDDCPEEMDKYVSNEGHFSVCFWKSAQAKITAEDLQKSTDTIETKIGSLPVHGVKFDIGPALYAISWIELPKEYKQEKLAETITNLGFGKFELSNKNVFGKDRTEIGKWYSKKGCTRFFGDNLLCIKERVFAHEQIFYRLVAWRNDINKRATPETSSFERESEKFFNTFQILEPRQNISQ